ncbi:Phosphatidylinositol 4-kinase beta [Eumeta japonica]|uniref:Phosphatidylinositol 4-kinase beta n=1 Tax=Eumeta variegata TaxID=151549 RepID=A0A4C1ZB46_EUMVA|nr:Phosphatidylinositol 4-kinase beta [Eumeta japonica]
MPSESLTVDWPPPCAPAYHLLEDADAADVWSHEDDELSGMLCGRRLPTHSRSCRLCRALAASGGSWGSREALAVAAGEVRRRLADATAARRPTPRHDPHDPSALALSESWENKLARMRTASPYGALPGWRLLGCIQKVGDDLRQEMLASQLLGDVCAEFRVVTSNQAAVGALLARFIELEHGPSTSEGFCAEQFCGVSCRYALLQVTCCSLRTGTTATSCWIARPHHPHRLRIHFLNIAKNLGFESSPFKLTQEFVEVMDGEDSDMFQYFKILILRDWWLHASTATRSYMSSSSCMAEAHRLLVEAYNAAVLSERTCRQWFQKFKNGDFDIEDKDRSRRPKIYEDVKLDESLEENLFQTRKELALNLEVTQQAVEHH